MSTDNATAAISKPPTKLDYSLTGENAARAVERGLAEADWYQCPVPRATMRKLLERRDGPAIRDTILWFALILGAGYTTFALRGTWWALLPYMVYAVLYASTSDSRWHEAGHGTAFKTDWMNNALYEIASFMVMRESTVWRWSHTRHRRPRSRNRRPAPTRHRRDHQGLLQPSGLSEVFQTHPHARVRTDERRRENLHP